MTCNEFAFGDSKVNGVPCVAKSIGKDMSGKVLTVAEEYDEVVRQRYGVDEGVLPASIAKSCWTEAVENIERRLQSERSIQQTDYLQQAVNEGKAIERAVF